MPDGLSFKVYTIADTKSGYQLAAKTLWIFDATLIHRCYTGSKIMYGNRVVWNGKTQGAGTPENVGTAFHELMKRLNEESTARQKRAEERYNKAKGIAP